MILEWAASGILGSIVGGLFRLAPEIIKFLDKKNERFHELRMFKLQTDLEKLRGEIKLEQKYVDYSIAQTDAIAKAFESQSQEASKSYRWVAAASALVRPAITYIVFGMYVAIKFIMIAYAVSSGSSWVEIARNNWTVDDFAMLNMILTFWFLGRPLEKRQSSS